MREAQPILKAGGPGPKGFGPFCILGVKVSHASQKDANYGTPGITRLKVVQTSRKNNDTARVRHPETQVLRFRCAAPRMTALIEGYPEIE